MTRRLLRSLALSLCLLAPLVARGDDEHGHKADAPKADAPKADPHKAEGHGGEGHKAEGHKAEGHKAEGHGADKAEPVLVTSPTPAEVNTLLVAGNGRFVKGATTHPHLGSKRLGEIAGAQHPFVTVLSCSDSRVPPELVFDTGIGDVFSVRVAGNVAESAEVVSVEHGIERLGTPLLLVMGHTKCTGGHAKSASGADGELAADAIRANVLESMATLLRDSESVRARVDSGRAQMIGAVYDLKTGTVEWLGRHPEEASLIAAAKKGGAALGGAHKAKGESDHGVTAHGASPHGASPQGASPHGAKPEEDHGEAHGGGHGTTAKGASSAAHDGGTSAHGDHGGPEAKAGHDGGTEAPQAPPYSFALIALLCTLGGAISGRASVRS